MIAQREKVIALLAILPDNLIGWIVAVGLCTVGMEIPLEKASWPGKWEVIHNRASYTHKDMILRL